MRRRLAFVVLLVVALFNSLDRMLVSILQEPIKAELHLSDTQLGLLTGLSFAIFYSTLTVPMAWIADRFSRKRFMALAVLLWSTMTALAALASGFGMLVLCRMGVALGESSATPSTLSLLSDYYPIERRGTPIAVWTMMTPLGAAFALGAGGWISTAFGWREAFMAAGLAGVLLAPVVLSMQEPVRGRYDRTPSSADARTILEVLRTLFAIRSFRLFLAGGSLQAFVIASSQYWAASFYSRVHHLPPPKLIAGLVLLIGVGGGIGALAGGYLLDRLGGRDRRWYGWLPALTSFAAIPFAIGQFLATSVAVSLALGLVATILLSMVLAPLSAITQSLVAAGMRAMTSAVLLIALNIAGLGLGTLTAGLLSDTFAGKLGAAQGLRIALVVCAIIAGPSFLFFWRSASSLPGDLPPGDN